MEGAKEVQGRWTGECAKALGVKGAVTDKLFEALRQNQHPITGEPLTPRDNANRVAFFNIQLSAPKDVNMLAMVGGVTRSWNRSKSRWRKWSDSRQWVSVEDMRR